MGKTSRPSLLGGKGKTTDPTGGRNPLFGPGIYDIQIDKYIVKKSRESGNLLFMVECDLMKIHRGPFPLKDGKRKAHLMEGAQVTYMISQAAGDMFVPNILAHLLQVGHLTQDKIDACDEKGLEDLCWEPAEEDQPLNGELFRVVTSIVTKKDGEPFPVSKFIPLEDAPDVPEGNTIESLGLDGTSDEKKDED